eukprot:GILK01007600.1.p1 GENE.GILK01007600.1~~GILK01007600.1.p1  ORF type:complete len:348 (+),score=49.14 GILK01007600.1:52-1095(+)
MFVAANGSVLAVVAYIFFSVVFLFFNKTILSVYNFRYVELIGVCQRVTAIVFLVVLKKAKLLHYPDFQPSVAVKLIPLSIAHTIHFFLSVSSLQGVNLPMYGALRRTGIVFVMTAEYFLQRKVPSTDVIKSVLVIIFGVLIAALRDFNFDATAYSYVFIGNIATAIYFVCINKAKHDTGLPEIGLMFYSNFMSFPLLLLMAANAQVFQQLSSFPYVSDSGFLCFFFIAIFLSFIVNYFVFLNTGLNSARTQAVSSQMKHFFSMFFAFFVFADSKFDVVNVVGLGISFIGSVWYAKITFTTKEISSKQRDKVPLAVELHAHSHTAPTSVEANGVVNGLPQSKKVEDSM